MQKPIRKSFCMTEKTKNQLDNLCIMLDENPQHVFKKAINVLFIQKCLDNPSGIISCNTTLDKIS